MPDPSGSEPRASPSSAASGPTARSASAPSAACGSTSSPRDSASTTSTWRTWTRLAARVLGWKGIGTIEPGNHADLIVVDRDPLTCSLDELPGTVVHATLLGGEAV